jgi:hypothetical protein
VEASSQTLDGGERRMNGGEQEYPAPGWDAIDAVMTRLYGSAMPRHVGYQPPAAASNNLERCSAYPAPGHWHYVSYGLSELYTPSYGDNPDVSGWGFELTFRVVRGTQKTPPDWPFTVLNELAKHVKGQKAEFLPGDRVDLFAPITGHPNLADAPPTRLTVFALTVDPQLGRVRTPNGDVTFLQVVGITATEKARMLGSSTEEVLEELAYGNPLLVTDPGRVQ